MSRKDQVLMLLQNAPYPQDARVKPESRSLIKNGYGVSVICPRANKQPFFELVEGVKVYRYPKPPDIDSFVGFIIEYSYAMIASFLLSIVVLVRDGFDLIHAHNPPDLFVIIALFYKLFGKKFIFDQHDISPELYNAKSLGQGNRWVINILIYFEKLSYRISDAVITTNNSAKVNAIQRGGISADKVTVVRNGPNPDKFKLLEPDPHLRSRADTLIGYVGVLGTQDGLDYLLRAINHLVKDLKRTDFCLFIMGEGAAENQLKNLADELEIIDFIEFTGWLTGDEFKRTLSSVDICVDPDPSNDYNDKCTMIKIMEYMAMSKPIVAFDLPEHRISAEKAAIYVPDNDEYEFAKALEYLMDNSDMRASMGVEGRNRVETKLSWQFSERNLLQLYKRIFDSESGKEFAEVNRPSSSANN